MREPAASDAAAAAAAAAAAQGSAGLPLLGACGRHSRTPKAQRYLRARQMYRNEVERVSGKRLRRTCATPPPLVASDGDDGGSHPSRSRRSTRQQRNDAAGRMALRQVLRSRERASTSCGGSRSHAAAAGGTLPLTAAAAAAPPRSEAVRLHELYSLASGEGLLAHRRRRRQQRPSQVTGGGSGDGDGDCSPTSDVSSAPSSDTCCSAVLNTSPRLTLAPPPATSAVAAATAPSAALSFMESYAASTMAECGALGPGARVTIDLAGRGVACDDVFLLSQAVQAAGGGGGGGSDGADSGDGAGEVCTVDLRSNALSTVQDFRSVLRLAEENSGLTEVLLADTAMAPARRGRVAERLAANRARLASRGMLRAFREKNRTAHQWRDVRLAERVALLDAERVARQRLCRQGLRLQLSVARGAATGARRIAAAARARAQAAQRQAEVDALAAEEAARRRRVALRLARELLRVLATQVDSWAAALNADWDRSRAANRRRYMQGWRAAKAQEKARLVLEERQRAETAALHAEGAAAVEVEWEEAGVGLQRWHLEHRAWVATREVERREAEEAEGQQRLRLRYEAEDGVKYLHDRRRLVEQQREAMLQTERRALHVCEEEARARLVAEDAALWPVLRRCRTSYMRVASVQDDLKNITAQRAECLATAPVLRLSLGNHTRQQYTLFESYWLRLCPAASASVAQPLEWARVYETLQAKTQARVATIRDLAAQHSALAEEQVTLLLEDEEDGGVPGTDHLELIRDIQELKAAVGTAQGTVDEMYRRGQALAVEQLDFPDFDEIDARMARVWGGRLHVTFLQEPDSAEDAGGDASKMRIAARVAAPAGGTSLLPAAVPSSPASPASPAAAADQGATAEQCGAKSVLAQASLAVPRGAEATEDLRTTMVLELPSDKDGGYTLEELNTVLSSLELRVEVTEPPPPPPPPPQQQQLLSGGGAGTPSCVSTPAVSRCVSGAASPIGSELRSGGGGGGGSSSGGGAAGALARRLSEVTEAQSDAEDSVSSDGGRSGGGGSGGGVVRPFAVRVTIRLVVDVAAFGGVQDRYFHTHGGVDRPPALAAVEAEETFHVLAVLPYLRVTHPEVGFWKEGSDAASRGMPIAHNLVVREPPLVVETVRRGSTVAEMERIVSALPTPEASIVEGSVRRASDDEDEAGAAASVAESASTLSKSCSMAASAVSVSALARSLAASQAAAAAARPPPPPRPPPPARPKLRVLDATGSGRTPFRSAELVVSFVSGYTPEDHVAFASTEPGCYYAAQKNVVVVRGRKIGAVTRGVLLPRMLGKQDLMPTMPGVQARVPPSGGTIVVQLAEAGVTAAEMSTIVRALRFCNVTEDPQEGERIVEVTARVAETGVSSAVQFRFIVEAVDDPASLIMGRSALFYRVGCTTLPENLKPFQMDRPLALPVFREAVVHDPDTVHFSGGYVDVEAANFQKGDTLYLDPSVFEGECANPLQVALTYPYKVTYRGVLVATLMLTTPGKGGDHGASLRSVASRLLPEGGRAGAAGGAGAGAAAGGSFLSSILQGGLGGAASPVPAKVREVMRRMQQDEDYLEEQKRERSSRNSSGLGQSIDALPPPPPTPTPHPGDGGENSGQIGSASVRTGSPKSPLPPQLASLPSIPNLEQAPFASNDDEALAQSCFAVDTFGPGSLDKSFPLVGVADAMVLSKTSVSSQQVALSPPPPPPPSSPPPTSSPTPPGSQRPDSPPPVPPRVSSPLPKPKPTSPALRRRRSMHPDRAGSPAATSGALRRTKSTAGGHTPNLQRRPSALPRARRKETLPPLEPPGASPRPDSASSLRRRPTQAALPSFAPTPSLSPEGRGAFRRRTKDLLGKVAFDEPPLLPFLQSGRCYTGICAVFVREGAASVEAAQAFLRNVVMYNPLGNPNTSVVRKVSVTMRLGTTVKPGDEAPEMLNLSACPESVCSLTVRFTPPLFSVKQQFFVFRYQKGLGPQRLAALEVLPNDTLEAFDGGTLVCEMIEGFVEGEDVLGIRDADGLHLVHKEWVVSERCHLMQQERDARAAASRAAAAAAAEDDLLPPMAVFARQQQLREQQAPPPPQQHGSPASPGDSTLMREASTPGTPLSDAGTRAPGKRARGGEKRDAGGKRSAFHTTALGELFYEGKAVASVYADSMQGKVVVRFSKGCGMRRKEIAALLRNLTYHNAKNAPTSRERAVARIVLTDGSWGMSQSFVSIQFEQRDQVAEILLSDRALRYRAGRADDDSPLCLAPLHRSRIDDADTAVFVMGGSLSVELQAGGQKGDVLFLLSPAQQEAVLAAPQPPRDSPQHLYPLPNPQELVFACEEDEQGRPTSLVFTSTGCRCAVAFPRNAMGGGDVRVTFPTAPPHVTLREVSYLFTCIAYRNTADLGGKDRYKEGLRFFHIRLVDGANPVDAKESLKVDVRLPAFTYPSPGGSRVTHAVLEAGTTQPFASLASNLGDPPTAPSAATQGGKDGARAEPAASLTIVLSPAPEALEDEEGGGSYGLSLVLPSKKERGLQQADPDAPVFRVEGLQLLCGPVLVGQISVEPHRIRMAVNMNAPFRRVYLTQLMRCVTLRLAPAHLEAGGPSSPRGGGRRRPTLTLRFLADPAEGKSRAYHLVLCAPEGGGGGEGGDEEEEAHSSSGSSSSSRSESGVRSNCCISSGSSSSSSSRSSSSVEEVEVVAVPVVSQAKNEE